jgi:large conductance mechanosensitive channel
MGFRKEFREFALKGNVVELAVAVILGAAFGAIISSLVEDVITPLILKPLMDAAGVQELDKLAWNAVKYGKFLAAVLKFLLVALTLFFLIRAINRMKTKKSDAVADAPAPPEYTLSEKLLMEIRDSVKKGA